MTVILQSPRVRDEHALRTQVRSLFASARKGARDWRAAPVSKRLSVLHGLRQAIVEDIEGFAAHASPRHADRADAVAAEVLPLLDAIKYLEKTAEKTLRAENLPREGRSGWIGSVQQVIHRDPRGVVLLVAPGNYPLLLVGVQLVQALAAGNAVAIKPAPGHTKVVELLVSKLEEAGLPKGLVVVLGEEPRAVDAALNEGVDLLVFTGSSHNGRLVIEKAARCLVPVVAELSGSDPVIVLEGADLDRVASALRFGLALNQGHTCIAPRRLVASKATCKALLPKLKAAFEQVTFPAESLGQGTREVIDEARALGAVPMFDAPDRAVVLTGVTPSMRVVQEDVAGPVLAVQQVADDSVDTLVATANGSNCALGASVFGPGADEIADQLDAGFVAIDDLIAPSADARVPFGGRRASGFGSTRGREGLLEMTTPRVVARRSGRMRHLEQRQPGDATLLASLARFLHVDGLGARLAALRTLIEAGRTRGSVGRNESPRRNS